MASAYALEKAAQAWCTERTRYRDMDSALAEAFADILDAERAKLRDLALNICADSELACEGEDGRFYGLCVTSSHINELCVLAGVGDYRQALDIVELEQQQTETP